MQPKFNTQINTKQYPSNTRALESDSYKEKLDQLFEGGDRIEIQKYYQGELEKASSLFDTYAGKNRPKFEFSSDPSVATAYFGVDEKGGNPHIKVGLEFFIKNKLSAAQAVWVLMHELTHFTDYAKNREYYMDQFEKAKELGAEMGDRIAQYKKEKGEEVSESQIKSTSEKLARIYSGIYYNITNDIYVNHNVATTAEYSHDKNKNLNSKQGEVEKLYKEVLFKERDMSSGPAFEQYMYTLLRQENVDEVVGLCGKVTEKLYQKHNIEYTKYESRRGFDIKAKQEMDTREIIKTFLNPNEKDILSGDIASPIYEYNKYTGKIVKDTDLEYRSKYIDDTILKTFSELLFEDMKDILDKTKDTGADMDEIDKMLDDVIKKHGESTPDFVPDEALERYADYKENQDKKDAEKAEEDKKTEEEKKKKDKADQDEADKKAEQEKIDQEKKKKEDGEKNKDKAMAYIAKKFAEKNGIAPDVVDRVIAAEKDTREYVEKLLEVFRRIVLDNQNEMVTDYGDKAYRDGQQFSVSDFVRNVPKIIDGNMAEVELFKRLQKVDNPSDRPERIEVSLIVDQSGSMGDETDPKNKIVERVVFMINTALDKFNDLLVDNKDRTRSKLHIDREILLVADTSKTIIPFSVPSIDEAENVKMGKINYESLRHIGSGVVGDNNQDHLAFESVRKTVDDEKLEKIQSGKVLKIVIEITDGEPDHNAVSEMRRHIQEMSEEGIVVFGLQIGDVDSDAFERLWNTDAQGSELDDTEKRGFVVGEDFLKLPEMVAMALAKYIGVVKIYD
jgi:hypothetical protein